VGSGFRTFTAGEVLTASNVQNYLMDQSVMVFGGSAARSSAIGTANFEEGMVSYLTDTDKVEAYNGTNWVSVAPTTTQGLTLINTTSFSGVSSQSINDVFSATYQNYRILIQSVNAGNGPFRLRLRVSGTDNSSNDYASAYYYRQMGGGAVGNISDGSTTSWTIQQDSVQSESNASIDIFRPFEATKTYASFFNNTQDSINAIYIGGMLHYGSTSFTGFTLFPANGIANSTGTVRVYGYNQ
jgi:hypothetical protein